MCKDNLSQFFHVCFQKWKSWKLVGKNWSAKRQWRSTCDVFMIQHFIKTNQRFFYTSFENDLIRQKELTHQYYGKHIHIQNSKYCVILIKVIGIIMYWINDNYELNNRVLFHKKVLKLTDITNSFYFDASARE